MRTSNFWLYISLAVLLGSCGRNSTENASSKENKDTVLSEETDTTGFITPVSEEEKLVRYHIVRKTTIDENDTVTDYFDANGKLIKHTSKNHLIKYTYNTQGKLTGETEFKDGKKHRETIYTLNAEGQTTKETVNEEEGNKTITRSETLFYYTGEQTDSTRAVLHLSTYDITDKTKFYHDSTGRLIKKENTRDNGESVFRDLSIYTYDPKTGLLDQESWQSIKENGEQDVEGSVRYTYNEHGDLIKKVNNALGMIQSYEYDYDERGLLIKETLSVIGKTQETRYNYFSR